jgi:hypothetical protein
VKEERTEREAKLAEVTASNAKWTDLCVKIAQDEMRATVAALTAQVEALMKAVEAFSDAYRTWSMIRRGGPGEALAFEQMHRRKVELDAALAAIREFK